MAADNNGFPEIFRVRQRFESIRVDDPTAEVERQMAALELDKKIAPGQSVAITAGSRGIANIVEILRASVDHFKRLGAKPFLVPAMGSHGGGTVDGQLAILESFGITEEAVGCPIHSDVRSEIVCHTAEGVPVHFDRLALAADHVFLCNRIKPHTMFVGDIESGLMKMMLIGLGKPEGAKIYHRACRDMPFAQIVRSVAGEVIQRCGVVAGLAIVENAYDETSLLEAIAPDELESREKELLVLARKRLPRLPFPVADLVLIDRIGKNISGVGMDVNIVGRKYNDKASLPEDLAQVLRIAIRRLTKETHGNASGMGIADFCLTSMLDDIDPVSTRLNSLTAGHIAGAMAPLDYATDREMIATALETIGLREPPDARIVWLADTLHLAECECSVAYLEEARKRDDLEIIREPRPWPLDADGNLPLSVRDV